VELASLLKGNNSLVELDLSKTSLGSLELKKISDALTKNRSLVSVNLSGNTKIGNDGIAAFCLPLAMNQNPILTTITLDSCAIGNEGAKKVSLPFFWKDERKKKENNLNLVIH